MENGRRSNIHGSATASTSPMFKNGLAPSLVVWDLRSDQTATTAIAEGTVRTEALKLPMTSTAATLQPKSSTSHSPDEWELYRTEITNLYASLPLRSEKDRPSVISTMEDRHSFFASPKQYKDRFRKWGLDRKNVKTNEMNTIIRTIVRRRQHEGKETQILLHGKQVPHFKVKRALRRREVALTESGETDLGTCSSIVCKTPPAIQSQDLSRSPSPLDNLAMTLLRPVQYANLSSPLFALCFSSHISHNPITKSLPLSNNFSFESQNLEDLIDLTCFVAGLQFVKEESVSQGRLRQEEEKLLSTLSDAETNGNILDYTILCAGLDKLGSILQAQSRWKSAEIVLIRAALVYQGIHGNSHRATLLTLARLAEVLNRQRRYDEAHDLFKFTWSVQLSSTDAGSFYDGLETMLGLSGVNLNQGKLREAQHLQEEILDSSKVVGEDHPTILKALTSMANTHVKRGRYKEGALIERRVLSLSIRKYGEENPQTAEVLVDLAHWEQNMGNHNEFHALILRCQAMTRIVLGDDFENMGNCLVFLARHYNFIEQFGIAVKYGQQAVAFFESKLGDDHLWTLLSKCCVMDSFLGLGLIDNAEKLGILLLDPIKNFNGSFLVLTFKNKLGQIYLAAGKVDAARQLFLEALEGKRKKLGDGHPEVKELRAQLALTFISPALS